MPSKTQRQANIRITIQAFKKYSRKKKEIQKSQNQEKPYHRIATLTWLLVNQTVTNQPLRFWAGLLYPCGCDLLQRVENRAEFIDYKPICSYLFPTLLFSSGFLAPSDKKNHFGDVEKLYKERYFMLSP